MAGCPPPGCPYRRYAQLRRSLRPASSADPAQPPFTLRRVPSRRRMILFAIELLIGAECCPLDYFDPGPLWVDLTKKKIVGGWQTKKVHLWIRKAASG